MRGGDVALLVSPLQTGMEALHSVVFTLSTATMTEPFTVFPSVFAALRLITQLTPASEAAGVPEKEGAAAERLDEVEAEARSHTQAPALDPASGATVAA